jgi:hypothetical protein
MMRLIILRDRIHGRCPDPIMTRIIRRRRTLLRHLSIHEFRESDLRTGVLAPQFAQLRRIQGEDEEAETDDEDRAGDADA